MLNKFDQAFGLNMPTWMPAFSLLLLLLVLWSIFWKGLALWHAAKRGDMKWFIVFLVINTAGILELGYLYFVVKLKFSELVAKTVN